MAHFNQIAYLLASVKTSVYHVAYTTVLCRFGFGRRVGKQIWEKEYQNNSWEYLSSPDEKAHYDAIIQQINEHTDKSDILDIGCGHGVLYNYFTNTFKRVFKYTGIDISEVAIKKASNNNPEADFKTADYDFEHVEGRFNIIILNEVLYYFVKPIKTLTKAFKDNLSTDGVVIVSMYQDDKGHNDLIWKDIDTHFKITNTQQVQNSKGVRWMIKTITLAIINLFIAINILIDGVILDATEKGALDGLDSIIG